jgi:hypothetical protein
VAESNSTPDAAVRAPIDYGHATKRSVPWKRLAKPVLIAMTVVVLVGGAVAVAWRGKLLSTQAGMLNYSPAAGQVVYEENPAEARRLLNSPGYRRGMMKKSSAYLEPPEWQEFRAAFHRGDNGYFVFAHERNNPSGSNGLVFVALYGHMWDENRGFKFDAEVIKPATFLKDEIDIRVVTQVLEMHLDHEDEIRFFAGQVDPADVSRFTIQCDVNGTRSTIDAKLTPTDSVEFTPRSGTLFRQGIALHWYPPGSKLPVPAGPPPPPEIPEELRRFMRKPD